MECRAKCGMCCIVPSIETPYFGMPHGKPFMTRCVHLTPDKLCGIFGSNLRPQFCQSFEPEISFCGNNEEQAQQLLAAFELETRP